MDERAETGNPDYRGCFASQSLGFFGERGLTGGLRAGGFPATLFTAAGYFLWTMTEPWRGFEGGDIALHSAWMRRLARGLLCDAAAADDVVQDAWTKLGPGRDRTGYLAAVVRSFALRRQRSERRRWTREREAARSEALASTAEVAARSELARLLAEAVERLAEPYRTTLVLRYYDDLPSAEIARRAGIPAATVRARLKRGLDVLRARLDERGGGRERWVSGLLPLTRVTPAAFVTSFVAMKIALASLLAAGAIILLWRGVSLDSSAGTSAGEGVESALSQVDASTGFEDSGDTMRMQALTASSGESRTALEPPAVATTPRASEVHARAVDEAGAAVPGAWLRLHRAPEASANGDDAGDLVLLVAPDELERLVSLDGSRTVEIAIGARSRRTRFLRPSMPEGVTSLELGEVTLPPGGVLHGRVFYEAGRGVQGALVAFGAPILDQPGALTACQGPGNLDTDPWDGREPAVVGTSGTGGEFRLEGLPAGYGTAWARTATSLWAFSEPIGMRAGEEVRGVELTLRDAPDETISGRVVDPDGRPLPGVELSFSPSGNDETERSLAGGGELWWNVSTDSRGEFHLALPGAGAQDITARSPSWEWEDLERRAVAPGAHDLVLAFERSRWLQVAVQDPNGASVRNGRVVGLPGAGPTHNALPRCESPLDEHGHARLRRPAAPLRVRVQAPGYRDQIVGPFDPALITEPLEVTLETVPALVGRVLLEDGRPAASARVSLHGAASASNLTHQGWDGDRDAFVYELMIEPIACVTADEQGVFRLPLPGVDTQAAVEVEDPDQDGGLSGLGYGGGPARSAASAKPDATWFLHAAVDGAATITSGPQRFDPLRDVELELRLPPAGSIAGKLVLEDGRSCAGWTACASDGLAQVAEAPVRPDGTFDLADLHAGGWQIRVFEPGRRYLPAGGSMRTERVFVPDVHVVAGQSVSYEHRTSARSSARFVGRLSLDGAPPGAWRVSMRTSTPQAAITSYEATLDPDGSFELSLEPGLSTELTIQGFENGANFSVISHPTILPGTNEWSFDLETGRLEGTIAPSLTSEPMFGSQPTYVCRRGDVTIRVSWTPAEDGRFGPLRVPAGRGTLRGPQSLSQRGRGPVWAKLDLGPGELRRVEISQR